MDLPSNPILLPMPKSVKCPKCERSWFWRTWYQGSERTSCSKCKSSVIPQKTLEKDQARLIKCPYCKGLQWYVGNKFRTSCTRCGKKNIMVRVIKDGELEEIIKKDWDSYTEKEQKYYLDRIEEYNSR